MADAFESPLDQRQTLRRRHREVLADSASLRASELRRRPHARSIPSSPLCRRANPAPAKPARAHAHLRQAAAETMCRRNPASSPTRAKDWMNFAFRLAMTMSQASAMLATGASGNAVDGCDHRKGQAAQAAHEWIVVSFQRTAAAPVFAGLGKPIAQILTCTEAAAGAGYHQRAAAFIRFSVLDRLAQRQMHRLVEGVELVRPVQGDDRDNRARLDEDGGSACHGLSRNLSSTPISFFSSQHLRQCARKTAPPPTSISCSACSSPTKSAISSSSATQR